MKPSLMETIEKILWDYFVPKVIPNNKKDAKLGSIATKILAYELGYDKDVERIAASIQSAIEERDKEMTKELDDPWGPEMNYERYLGYNMAVKEIRTALQDSLKERKI